MSIRYEINRVFTFCDRSHRFDQYKFTWNTNAKGIPLALTDWCTENCLCDWGWWFDEKGLGIVGFMNREEMIQAMLLHHDLVDYTETS